MDKLHLLAENTKSKGGIRNQMDWRITMSYLNFLKMPSVLHETTNVFPLTKNYIMKLLLIVRSRKMFGTILAWWKNHIGHFENRLQQFSRFKMCSRLSSRLWHITRSTFLDTYYSEEELNASDMAEERLMSRMYSEVTHIL